MTSLLILLDAAGVTVERGDSRAEAALTPHAPTWTTAAERLPQVDTSLLMDAVTGAIHAVVGEGAGRSVERIVLHTASRSVIGIGRENILLTPTLFDTDPEITLPPPPQMLPAPLAAQVRRFVGAGALIVRFLSREWIDVRGRAPAGLPVDPRGDYVKTRTLWDEIGVKLTYCPLLVPHSAVIAQSAPEVADAFGLPPFVPIVSRDYGR